MEGVPPDHREQNDGHIDHANQGQQGAGAVAAGTPVAVPAHILAIPDLISGPDTWVQRDSDAYVDLYRRVAIARQADADLFISLHADAGADPALAAFATGGGMTQGQAAANAEFTTGRGPA